jgi:hypothetical protein
MFSSYSGRIKESEVINMKIDTSVMDGFEEFGVPQAAVTRKANKEEGATKHYHYEIDVPDPEIAGMIALGATLIAISVIKLLSK